MLTLVIIGINYPVSINITYLVKIFDTILNIFIKADLSIIPTFSHHCL